MITGYSIEFIYIETRGVILNMLQTGCKQNFGEPRPLESCKVNSNSFLDFLLSIKFVPGNNTILYSEQILT